MSIYNGLDNQLQNLQNQLSQITQLYNGGQAPQPVPVMHTQRQVIQVQGWRGIEDFRLNPGESVLAQDADAIITPRNTAQITVLRGVRCCQVL